MNDASGAPRTIVWNAATMILLLAAVGAGIDAVVLVRCGVLTAAQTGNTILLAVALGQGRWMSGLAAGISVVGYVLGAAAGELIIDDGGAQRAGSPRIAAALIVELLLLSLIVVGWWRLGMTPPVPVQDGLIALAAIAMGIQSTATLCLHVGPATTYVTGTLTTFTTQTMRGWRRPPRVRPPAAGGRTPTAATGRQDRPWMYGLTWLFYLAAATVTALIGVESPRAALALPIAFLAVVVAMALGSMRSGLHDAASPELPQPRSDRDQS